MLSTATVTFDIADQLGNDFDPRRTKVWLTTNVPGDTVIDRAANKIRLGSGNVTLNADGTGSIVVWVPGADANPASWQTTIHVDYPDRNAANRGRGVKSFGPFTITGNADLADLVAEMPVQPEYAAEVFERLDALEEAVGEGGDTIVIGDGGALIVSAGGTINLDESLANGTLVGYRFTGAATVEGIALTAGTYVFERNTTSPSGWTYRIVATAADLPLPDVDPDPGGGDVETTPQQPTWNDSLLSYVIANTTGVQYKKAGTNIAAGTYDAAGGESVTITAVPKTGYVFPGGVATSWTHAFPTPTSWTTVFSDTLLSPTGVVTARTGWTVSNPNTDPSLVGIDGSGLWLTGVTTMTAQMPGDALKHYVEGDYDLTNASTSGVERIYFDVAWSSQPHRHILKRTGASVELETWYHNTLNGDTYYLTGLPLSGKFRAESDGTYVYAYANGTKVAEAPHDPSLTGGNSPVFARVIARGEALNSGKTRLTNVVMATRP